MRCSDFLDSYSEFRDGLIVDVRLLRGLNHHLANCPGCHRHDVLVRRGVMALRAGADLTPSADFRRRLRARLAGGEPAELDQPVFPGRPGIAVSLMLAAALGLLIYEGLARRPGQPARTAALVATAQASPQPLVVANPGMPFVTFADLRLPSFPDPAQHWSGADVPLGTWANLPR
jgi:hypothetical protein